MENKNWWTTQFMAWLNMMYNVYSCVLVCAEYLSFVSNYGAPCGFSGRFEDGSFSMKAKMKICSNLHWRMKMWRSQISGLLKNEDYQLTEDLKTRLKNVKKMKTMSCAGSPTYFCRILVYVIGLQQACSLPAFMFRILDANTVCIIYLSNLL